MGTLEFRGLEFSRLRLRKARMRNFIKNLGSWYLALVDFDVPNDIQSREHSTDGGTDGARYESRRLCRQRQLERRRPEVERQRMEAGRRQLECRQSGFLSKLPRFSHT